MTHVNVTPDGQALKEHYVLAGNKMTAETASSAPGKCKFIHGFILFLN